MTANLENLSTQELLNLRSNLIKEKKEPVSENFENLSTPELIKMRENILRENSKNKGSQLSRGRDQGLLGTDRQIDESAFRTIVSPTLGIGGDLQQIPAALMSKVVQLISGEEIPFEGTRFGDQTPGQQTVNDLQQDLIEQGDLFNAALLNDDDILPVPFALPRRQDITAAGESIFGEFEPISEQQEMTENIAGTTLQGFELGGPLGAILGFLGAGGEEIIQSQKDLSPRQKAVASLGLFGTLSAGGGIYSNKSPAKTPIEVRNLQSAKLGAFERANIKPTVSPFLTPEAETSRMQSLGLRSKAGKKLIAENVSKIIEQSTENVEDFVKSRVESSFRDFGDFDLVDPFSRTVLEEKVNQQTSVLSDTPTIIDSGNFIKQTLQDIRQAYRGEAKNLYTRGKQGAAESFAEFPSTLKSAVELRQELQKAGRASSPARKNLLARIDEIISEISHPTSDGRFVSAEIPVDKAISLKETLNEISDIDVPIPRLKSRLQEIAEPLRKEIRSGLEVNESALNAFNSAELMWAEQAQLFDEQPSVLKARTRQTAPEEVVKIKNPSDFQQFVRAVGDSEQGKQAVQTLLKEVLRDKNKPSDLPFIRELYDAVDTQLKPFISEHAKTINPKGSISKFSLNVNQAADAIAQAIETGDPTRIMVDLNQTMKQRNILKTAVKQFEQSDAILNAIDTAYLESFIKNASDENGQINPVKIKRILKDKDFSTVIRDMVGQEGVQFFNDLSTISESVIDVMNRFPNLKTGEGSSINNLARHFAVGTLLGPKAEAINVIASMATPSIVKIAQNRAARNAMNRIASQKGKKSSPSSIKQMQKDIALINGILGQIEQTINQETQNISE